MSTIDLIEGARLCRAPLRRRVSVVHPAPDPPITSLLYFEGSGTRRLRPDGGCIRPRPGAVSRDAGGLAGGAGPLPAAGDGAARAGPRLGDGPGRGGAGGGGRGGGGGGGG